MSEGQKNWHPQSAGTVTEEVLLPCMAQGIDLNCLQHPSPATMLYVVAIPNQGRGMFAVKDISAGSLILREHVLVVNKKYFQDIDWINNPKTDERNDVPRNKQEWNKYLADHVSCRGREVTRAFISLPAPEKKRLGPFAAIVAHNSFFIDHVTEQFLGVGPSIAKINHSCVPNTQQVWENNQFLGKDEQDDRRVMGDVAVYAVKNIEAGEEITVQYMRMWGNAAHRKESLKAQFGFDCSCHACTGHAHKKERLFAQMADTYPKLQDLLHTNQEPWTALAFVHKMLRCCAGIGITDIREAIMWDTAALIAARHSDLARAGVCLGQAIHCYLIMEGKLSKLAFFAVWLAKDPRRIPGFGVTDLGRSSLEEASKLVQGGKS